MNVLIGCEETQEVCKAFRKKGHEAFSCDLQNCSGGHPEWHLQMDIFEAIELKEWDRGIFFPPCTFITVSSNRWYKDQPQIKSGKLVGAARREAREKAIEFVKRLYNCKIEKVCIENPIGILSTTWRKPSQIIQPWMFGHGEQKATCLWLKRLPRLNGFDVVEGREQKIWKMTNSEERSRLRSKTYPGIAAAMAEQWG